METITEFIKPELLVLVPALYMVGVFLKSAGWFADKYIPAALGVTGVLLAILWVMGNASLAGPASIMTAIFTALVQGLLCAGAAVYTHQMIKQAKEGDD